MQHAKKSLPLVFAERHDSPFAEDVLQPGHAPEREAQFQAGIPAIAQPRALHKRRASAARGRSPQAQKTVLVRGEQRNQRKRRRFGKIPKPPEGVLRIHAQR